MVQISLWAGHAIHLLLLMNLPGPDFDLYLILQELWIDLVTHPLFLQRIIHLPGKVEILNDWCLAIFDGLISDVLANKDGGLFKHRPELFIEIDDHT